MRFSARTVTCDCGQWVSYRQCTRLERAPAHGKEDERNQADGQGDDGQDWRGAHRREVSLDFVAGRLYSPQTRTKLDSGRSGDEDEELEAEAGQEERVELQHAGEDLVQQVVPADRNVGADAFAGIAE